MKDYRTLVLVIAALMALALAGCSANDASRALGQASSSPAQPATTVPAQPTAEPAAANTSTSAPNAQPVQLPPATPVPQQAQQQLDATGQTINSVYQRVAPAVVRIMTGQGLGSGFLVDTAGHIITNNHVVEGSQGGTVRVAFSGLFETEGQVVATDPDSDIAVVKAADLPKGVTPVELGDSSQVSIGQMTIAIGNPLAQDRTVTTGIVSAIGRTISEQQGSYSIGGAIQTDAAINPGNSGGPLLNSRGQVIGMNTAILSQSGASSGIGFAVPVNLIKKVSAVLIQSGSYQHPYLGVGLKTVTTLDAQQNNLPSAGILIQSRQGGPVAAAGLQGQAVLTAINGQQMTSEDDVISYLELNTKPGDTVTLTVIDGNGQKRDLQVKLAARPRVEDRQPG